MTQAYWWIAGIFGFGLLLFIFSGSIMGGWGMMGGYGMMGNGGYAPLGWFGMIFMWLIPIGLLVLAILGVLWFVRKGGNPRPPSA